MNVDEALAVATLERKVDALVRLAVMLLDAVDEAASNPMVGAMLPAELGDAIAEARASLTATT